MDKYIDYYNDSKKVTYHEQTDISNILKLRAVLKTLPDFCKDYFRAMDPLTTTKTRISYAYDIRIFLDRKSTRLNSSHITRSRMPSSA